MKTPLQILLDARAFLTDEKRWVKGAYSLGGLGDEMQCCLMGALIHRGYDPQQADDTANLKAKELLAKAVGPRVSDAFAASSRIQIFNDAPTTTHADVLAVLDAAIELARYEAEQR
jgi:hypothetical protein